MKVYTKKGDKGLTSLIGGTRVPKHHLRIEAYGTVDELNSRIGLLRDLIVDQDVHALLLEIQDRLFTMGSLLAEDTGKSKMALPKLNEADVRLLEKAIDTMEETLPAMKSFVLPGGHATVSYCHITRCVCRRAERLCTQLAEAVTVNERILSYLNRLSDYLFVSARKLTKDLGAKEIPWQPKMDD